MRTLKDRAADLIGGERRYDVSGNIGFVLEEYAPEPDLGVLAYHIRSAGAKFPWCDESLPSVKFESIGYLSEGEVVVHAFPVPLKIVWFHIAPGRGSLRKAQVYAYEKYLAKLAEELATNGVGRVFHIVTVTSTIEIHAASHFQVAR